MGRLIVKILLIFLVSTTIAEEMSIKEIYQKSNQAYESLKFYKSSGKITSDVNGTQIETDFTISLIKPDHYLIEWRQKFGAFSNISQNGAVWNSDGQAYLYMGINKSYSKIESDTMAISSATGISGGAAMTIPAKILVCMKDQPSGFDRLIKPELLGSETVLGEDCYYISGSTDYSKEVSYWISKKTFFIRKVRTSYEKPEGLEEKPLEMSDEDIHKMLESLGQKVTDENLANMKEMFEKSQKVARNTKMKGFSEETHHKITVEKFEHKELKFKLPEDVLLKNSLFDHMFQEKEHDHSHH